VHSNSPIVIGSVATFRAAMCNLNDSLLNERFVYVWINNAVNHSSHLFDITTTLAGATTNMSKVFSVYVLPGHYIMEVRAYREPYLWLMASKHLRPFAVGFHNFTLIGMVYTLCCDSAAIAPVVCGCSTVRHVIFFSLD